jgi:hypothetical protein
MAALGISMLWLNGFGQDKNPVCPKADSTVAAAKGKENNDNSAVPAATYSNTYLFDESKQSPRQKEFLAKKRLIEFQYADSSESSREERIARMKSDFFEKRP